MVTTFNGREVECEVSFAREPEDCFIESAVYTDTGEALTSDELDTLQDEAGALIDEAYNERAIDHADMLLDRAKEDGSF